MHLSNIKYSYLDLERKTGDPRIKERLRFISNKLKNLKRKGKRNYYSGKIEKEKDGRKLWDILKEVTNTTKQKEEIEPENANQDTANSFNSYFANIGKDIQQTLNVTDAEQPPSSNNKQGFAFQPENIEIIEKIIKGIRPTVATGYCNIPARILIDLCEDVSQDLCDLVNLGYKCGRFPTAMKHAVIKAIFKQKGSPNSEFYRPIFYQLLARSSKNQLPHK